MIQCEFNFWPALYTPALDEIGTGRERACHCEIKINDLGPLLGCFSSHLNSFLIFRNFRFHCKILFGLLQVR